MAEPWWRPLAEETRLSQGDIIAQTTFGIVRHPTVPLVKHDVRGAGSVWKETSWTTDGQGYCHCLARGRVAAAIVLTHSCQLDKTERTGRVIVAPLAPSSRLDDSTRDLVMAGQRISFVPLPEIPELGDSYADLRLMTALDRKTVDQLDRLATMTDPATRELQTRLVGFFARDGVGRDADPPR